MLMLLQADLFKTRKRLLGWVLLLICALVVALSVGFGAWLAQSNPQISIELFPAALLSGPQIVSQSLGNLLMAVLGASLAGSEYRYDTWKVLLTRHASRVALLLSKWITLLLLIVIGSALIALWSLALTAGLGTALGVVSPSTTPLTTVLLGIGVALLTLVVPGTVALLGAVVTRSTTGGIVAGIVWSALDGLVPLISQLPAGVRGLSFSAASTTLLAAATGQPAPYSVATSLIVALAYLLAPVAIAAWIFRQRDML